MVGAGDHAARYLRALEKLHPSRGHEIRALLGNLVLQIGLLEEMSRRSDAGGTEQRAKLERTAAKAGAAAREVHGAIERLLSATRFASEDETRYDLRESLREVEAQVAPHWKARRVACTVRLPEAPVMVEGRRDLAWRALLVALAEAGEGLPPGSEIGATLNADATLAIAASDVEAWGPGLREAVEEFGGEVRWDAGESPSRVTIHLPVRNEETR